MGDSPHERTTSPEAIDTAHELTLKRKSASDRPATIGSGVGHFKAGPGRTGQQAQDKKLADAGMDVKTSKVDQIPNQHAYQSQVTVTYTPAFGAGFSIPTLSGPIQVVPDSFDITYTAIKENAVY